MSTYATRLASHASLIRSKSVTFGRLLLFFMRLLWESSPRLLVASIFCATTSRALRVISLLGTLKLAYVVFNPPTELIAVVEPIEKIAGLPTSNFIAIASAILIAAIFAAAALMAILETHYKDETIKKFELFLAKSSFEFKKNRNSEIKIEPPKLAELTQLANNTINALSLSAILAATWALLFAMSPNVAMAMAFCATLVFGLILYFGSRIRRKSSKFRTTQEQLNAALESGDTQMQETTPEQVRRMSATNQSVLLARMLATHESRSQLSKYAARLNAITLLSTGVLIGIAILLITKTNIVGVILVLLLVRFFLDYAKNLANILQAISNRLDVLDWTRMTFSGSLPGK